MTCGQKTASHRQRPRPTALSGAPSAKAASKRASHHISDMSDATPEQRSPAAHRARRYRSRQSRGTCVIAVSRTHPEMDALVRLGLLKPELRRERHAVRAALRSYLSHRLPTEQRAT